MPARLASGGALEGDMHVEARALGQRDQGFEVEAVDAPAHEIVQTRLRHAEALRGLRAAPARFVLHIAPALRYNGETMTTQRYKIVVERHPEGYVAYPLGLKGVVVGEGETADEAIADVRSAIAFHIETFGDEAVEAEAPVLDAFVTETDLAV